MTTVKGLSEVQAIIEYNFRSINLLVLALTAAGADEKIYDGNRKMAQLGESLIELLLADDAFMAGCSRGEIPSLSSGRAIIDFISRGEQKGYFGYC